MIKFSINNNITIKKLTIDDYYELSKFCKKCNYYNFNNNKDFKSLKIDKFEQGKIDYYLIIENDKIVGITGVDDLSHILENTKRILYRTCILPEFKPPNKNLSYAKFHMNWIPWSHITPIMIKDNINYNLVFTTNNDSNNVDNSGRMFRVHNSLKNLIKYNIIINIGTHNIYYTKQTVWEINIDNYFYYRKKFFNDDLNYF